MILDFGTLWPPLISIPQSFYRTNSNSGVTRMYTPNQREGESGFAFPEGLPKGQLANTASRPEVNTKGNANTVCPEPWLEV